MRTLVIMIAVFWYAFMIRLFFPDLRRLAIRLWARFERRVQQMRVWTGLDRPRSAAYLEGQKQWRSMKSIEFQYGDNWRSAEQAARQIVQRLAPEIRIDDEESSYNGTIHFKDTSSRSEIGARSASISSNRLLDGRCHHHCCAFTFDGYTRIPRLEQSLTIYLYWKYFPKRFKSRPMRADYNQ